MGIVYYIDNGRERYAKTRNIKNMYEEYMYLRNDYIAKKTIEREYNDFVKLKELYIIEEHLINYSRELLRMTVESGSEKYMDKLPIYNRFPYIIFAISTLFVVIMLSAGNVFSKSIVDPIIGLSIKADELSKNNFECEDLVVTNKDEIGELVDIFNIMKASTLYYIRTLKDNHKMNIFLQEEKTKKIEMEKKLEETRMELLKSQINPHFLFNTLNMIEGMTVLEDAEQSGKMVRSLANIFRYNLNSEGQFIFLEDEMRVLRDYIYIQKMRFGERIQYKEELPCNDILKDIKIPVFTLQPLIENSIIHGIIKKEEGGVIHLKVDKRKEKTIIYIFDNGCGIEKTELEKLRIELATSRTARVGIGLGNIYKRVENLYEESYFGIFSVLGKGTVIKIILGDEAGKNQGE